ncbi:MAG: hypothetical protein ABF991_00380 [Liquorilactobacillus hordei]|uniref:hypothetical protein n=1 Tax=Liquorilactobacillus hordei TaxID=468911 RepID=UPI0039E7A9E8
MSKDIISAARAKSKLDAILSLEELTNDDIDSINFTIEDAIKKGNQKFTIYEKDVACPFWIVVNELEKLGYRPICTTRWDYMDRQEFAFG